MKLVYLNNCATDAHGRPHAFMVQELPWLLKHFDTIEMIGYHGVCTISGETKPSYPIVRPLGGIIQSILMTPFRKELWQEMRRLYRDKKLTLINALKLIAFTQRGLKMYLWAEQRLKLGRPSTVYSFWLSYDAYAGALIRKRHPRTRFVARGHYYDIDLARNHMNPYLMKEFIGQQADDMYMIGKLPMEWYMSYMRGRVDESKVHVLALGSTGEKLDELPVPNRFSQDVLRIVSCSRVAPIKRLDIIIDALAQWEGMPVLWMHIGDGSEMEKIRAYAEEKLDSKENVIYQLPGSMKPAQIHALYEKTPFDVFINTSEGEGVPVSIMEAMRCGIPAIAADVGGTAELVVDGCGWTFDFDEGAQGVLRCLTELSKMTLEEAMTMRKNAQDQWEKGFKSSALLEEMLK
ncbi:MAG: glycosyltransferase [Clostridia bacterium]|nr:glycosyltransferase [Clostridia bacterium]